MIKIIRGSADVATAKQQLMERFALSEAQANAIVEMRLRALTGLERNKLEEEYKSLMELITELKAILADEKKLLGVIKEKSLLSLISMGMIVEHLSDCEYDISMEDMIPVTNTVITFTKLGSISSV